MNRKKGVAAAAILALVFLLGFVLRQNAQIKNVQRVEATGFVMDTVLTQTIYTTGEDPSGEILQQLSELEKKTLSWTEPEAEVSQLNAAAGTAHKVSEELLLLLEKTLALSEASGGALDPTMGQVIRLWGFGGENAAVPDPEELASLLEKVDYRKVQLQEGSVLLPEGVTLDLGAVGKGAGCDRISAFLAKHQEISGALISLGSSSMLTYGEKPDGTPWKIGIRDPRSEDPGEYLGVAELTGLQFLSTSGDYEQFFEKDGVRYHHILDPETGYPADSGLASVTVVAGNGLISDGLSTACFILGLEEGRQLLRSYDAAGIFITTDGEIITEGDVSFILS